MKYLITGGCGFVGSNLAQEVLKRGDELVIFDNLFRHGSSSNLESLKKMGTFKYYPFDIRNVNDVETVIKLEKPDVIFHLAGQVAMTTSIDNPRLDFEINAMGTFNLLDAVRKYTPSSAILYSSSNKVYGDFDYLTFEEEDTRYSCKEYPKGFDENITLDFHSPYGCSKGAADQYLLDFARIYKIKTVVFRHSSMYGGNQHSTIDQGWIGWFCQQALDIKNKVSKEKFTISGSGKQVRDVLHADDVVSLYFKSVKNIDKVKGQAFNIGGGIENSLSLLELFAHLQNMLSIEMDFNRLPARESDQLFFVADNESISKLTGWSPKVSVNDGLGKMLEWLD
jgi:CDP-paratose 2-epimerase